MAQMLSFSLDIYYLLCYIYQKRISFIARHLEEVVSIQIKFDGHKKRKASGFPHNLLWFIQEEKQKSAFKAGVSPVLEGSQISSLTRY